MITVKQFDAPVLAICAAVFVTTISFGFSCTKQQRAIMIDVAQDACVIIPFIDDQGIATKVCATVNELAPYARLIAQKQAAMRSLQDGGAEPKGDAAKD